MCEISSNYESIVSQFTNPSSRVHPTSPPVSNKGDEDFHSLVLQQFKVLSEELGSYRNELCELKNSVQQNVPKPTDKNVDADHSAVSPRVTSTPYNQGMGSVCYRKPVKNPQDYDGTSSLMDYMCHFEICAHLNNWTSDEMALHLAGSLKGRAQKVLSSMKVEDRKVYSKLISALEDRFLPPNQSQLYRAQLKARKRQSNESLPELGEAVKRLVAMAYPSADCDLLNILSKDAFVMHSVMIGTWCGRFKGPDPAIWRKW
ncbi:hypothetical protein SNE40_018318 [Patella caerulea]|uniref:Uncharacterized protein n=1 Tax=Patella caerulea TaxID=87958 RepID=A0AAN8J8I4_PATCE